MILPPGFRGVAFASAADGDARSSATLRSRLARELDLAEDWAYPTQVHGMAVMRADLSGNVGEADGIFTGTADLPVVVATADCVPIVLEGPEVVGVIHVGWRGAIAGVVPAMRAAIASDGYVVNRAAIGPSIGPCCYEVGHEVADRFKGFISATRWGALSVDIVAFVESQLDGVEVWRSDVCTFDSAEYYSYRQSKTAERQVAIGWIPSV